MKKKGSFWGFIKLFSSVLFVIVIIVFCFVKLFPETKAKDYGCAEYSLSCELQKDYVLLYPLTFDSTLVDVLGNKINTNKKLYQWYVIGTKVKVLIPTTVPVTDGWSGDQPNYEYYPSIEKILATTKEIKVDTTDLSSIIPGLTKAVVVVSGPNEVRARFRAEAILATK